MPTQPQPGTPEAEAVAETMAAEKAFADLFAHHSPTGNAAHNHGILRNAAHIFGRAVLSNTKPSREQSAAIAKIREAMMWANAAVAIHGSPEDEPAKAGAGDDTTS